MTSLTSLKLAPFYAWLLLLVGAFITGATMRGRFVPSADVSLDDVPDSWLAAGAAIVMVALIGGAGAFFGAVMRYFAYRRLEDRYGQPAWLRIPALVLEAIFLVIALWVLWVATANSVRVGTGFLVFIWMCVIWFVVSLGILIVGFVFGKRRPITPII
ncbi:hypothetical protein [Demequina sp.]|uniref:hypothetical protein n=1 Tax=Demequina sp. TaxID=2050685 RepID=UPI003D0FCF72